MKKNKFVPIGSNAEPKEILHDIEEGHVYSVISSETEEYIDIQDGDEYLLSSTNESGTAFYFPEECYLVGDLSYFNNFGWIGGFGCHFGGTYVSGIKNERSFYFKRVGNIIFVTTEYDA